MDDEVQLIGDNLGPAEDYDLCKNARALRGQHFGEPRSSPAAPRIDTGKRKREDPNSEATFPRKRRVDVAAAAADHVDDVAVQSIRTVDDEHGSRENHEREGVSARQASRAASRVRGRGRNAAL